jgi:hypothetical protein
MFGSLRSGALASAPPTRYRSPVETEMDLWKSGSRWLSCRGMGWNSVPYSRSR